MERRNQYKLTGPCSNCPCRNDGKGVGHLREGRIRDMEQNADPFFCHQTWDYTQDEDEEGRGHDAGSQVCGGWLSMQWKTFGGFPAVTAFAARLGMFDPYSLRVSEVWADWEEMLAAQEGEQ